jgi:hypothetical protein
MTGATPIEPTTDLGLKFLTELATAAAGYREYGTQSLDAERTGAVVHWHGDLPSAVNDVIVKYTRAGLSVHVRQTQYVPGDLRDEAERIRRDFPAEVAGASPTHAFDGISVTLNGDGGSRSEAEQALQRLGIESRFPLTAEYAKSGPL